MFCINRRTSPDQCDVSMLISSGAVTPSKSYDLSTHSIQPTFSEPTLVIETPTITPVIENPTATPAIETPTITPTATPNAIPTASPVTNTTRRSSAQSIISTSQHIVLVTISAFLITNQLR